MMSLLLRKSILVCLVLNLLRLLFGAHALSCHEEDGSALLQFKGSFIIDTSVSTSGSGAAYPKVSSWRGPSVDCCSWDGVECDNNTGRVTGLILDSSGLSGSIDSSSSLFGLINLEKLNLADNHFNYSRIPSAFGRLSRLVHLNLSNSMFSGQVPLEVSHLSRLTSLDLSSDFNDPAKQWLLELKNPDLQSLIRDLTSLESLSLDSVYIPSRVPDFVANFTFLKSLSAVNCGLRGEFPSRIFHLPRIRTLNIQFNYGLTGHFPEFRDGNTLENMFLGSTGFTGMIPSSIGKLQSLTVFNLGRCNFSGSIPPSLGDLAKLRRFHLGRNHFVDRHIPPFLQNLTRLESLYLNGDRLAGPIPSWLGNLNQLVKLSLRDNNFSGHIPSSLQNLSRLVEIYLDTNSLMGPIPSWIGNLTQLESVLLYENQLNGHFPESVAKLVNLVTLSLDNNNLSGTVNFDMFFNIRPFLDLHMCQTGASLHFGPRNPNATISKFQFLSLCDCNLTEFPYFLEYQNTLRWLSLSTNKIKGEVPEWLWNTSLDTLRVLDLSGNFITSFHRTSTVLPWHGLKFLVLSGNMLRGRLPIPPPSVIQFDVSHNLFSGEISPLICNLSSLYLLDVSFNNLSATIPPCLGNFSDSLNVLNFRSNSFTGDLPSISCELATRLTIIDLSQNQLEGEIPRSLATCTSLETLNLKDNRLADVFPVWLGTIPALKHLILGKNLLFGEIGKPEKSGDFSNLRVVDLSRNNFSGGFPSDYVSSWTAMKAITIKSNYLEASGVINAGNEFTGIQWKYPYSFIIVNKGVETNYTRVQAEFVEKFKQNKTDVLFIPRRSTYTS